MSSTFRIFAQAKEAVLDPAAIVRTATRFFEAEVEIESFEAPSLLVVRLTSARRALAGTFRIEARCATAEDYDAARAAEERGRAGGMGLLAARCPSIWEIATQGDLSEASMLNLCAVLAAVALGPTLPPDESTLYGVRGAMERLEALTGRSLAR
jgi:hypothetical protein